MSPVVCFKTTDMFHLSMLMHKKKGFQEGILKRASYFLQKKFQGKDIKRYLSGVFFVFLYVFIPTLFADWMSESVLSVLKLAQQ